RGKLPDADLALLEGRLADPDLDQEPRSHLLFALAGVLDAREDYSRAALCLRQAHAIRVELDRDRREYVPADHERFVDNLLRQFDASFFERTAGLGLDTRRPVFVFGLPRSGTTLIEQILASHPQVFGAGELRLARLSFDSMPRALDRADLPINCIPHLDEPASRRLAQQHLDSLHALDQGRADRVVDKMPDNYMYIGLLAILFPQGVYIHCRRDLRDVAVSCWMTDFRSLRWTHQPEHIGSRFRQYLRLMEHWRAVLPLTVHEVRYEETVEDLEGVARRLVAACALPWNPACLDFHRTRRPVRTASITQVRQPIYRRSVARWKHYERELAELFSAIPAES
ncbi:MAG: sulfotransferase family protein, partial [Isosphaeraceae bacterium]